MIRWQYNGVAPFDEITDWCKQNIQGFSVIKFETIWFHNESDYILFLLRWA